ncbi:complement component C6 isoform X1 [Melanotaenia boesemani]|uniref:complement component C6 isoform X1 n=1 Tax=Melanotaenia boesemani TaxID=1250792 RepID=UPI001C04627E|nr:complement component C6 isoform X1 [Melanotaenia boesemani]
MTPSSSLVLLQLLSCISSSLACFCDKYAWTPWSACTMTCNHGTQSRQRQVRYDEYYWKNSCYQMCEMQDTRSCNVHACPINCQLTEFGPWSDCSPCAKKQFRTQSVVTPSQFGGSKCSGVLKEERNCYPSKECKLPKIDCKDKFKCSNDRCINSTLTCNRQNDCGDNSDERNCAGFTDVCLGDMSVSPGAELLGNGFDALAEEPRGAVLDNRFMGEICNIRRPGSLNLYYRVPHNFEKLDIQVGVLEDFSNHPQEVHSETISTKSSSSSQNYGPRRNDFLFVILYLHRSQGSQMTKNRDAYEASKKKDSKFFRVHQIMPVSTFKIKDKENIVLTLPFLEYLHALPLDYNYGLYREIFQLYGTHYYSSGKLGGHYDLMYQFSREELRTSGESEEHFEGCLGSETAFTVILYTQYSSVTRCKNNRMTEKYEGSYIKSSEKSFSMVKGGRSREAAALAWERERPTPDQTSYKNWAKSVIDNPAVVEYELLPIIDLVRGIPCAVTKRRHLRRALLQYLEEFDSCKCAPCPNNAKPVLSGTECKCVCQTGTFGDNCEKRAPDYTSEAVDGYWSCWGPWTSCGVTMRRQRTRQCNNPTPLKGGQACKGPDTQEETCHVSLFEKQDSCDNDDDFYVGWRDELPPGVEGCLRPKRPPNSFLRKAKQYYSFGEDEEFQCFTGFENDDFQYINCLPDGTWTEPQGKCVRKYCAPPEIPKEMTLFPNQNLYKVGVSVGLNCKELGLLPLPLGFYRCTNSLTWDPPIPADLRCTDELPVDPDSGCGPGQTLEGSRCVCIERESCLSNPNTICVLNTNLGVALSMSLCAFNAGRCHGDPLFFISESLCDPADSSKLEWAKFRAQMSSKSSLHVPCGLDTCYEWETCTASKCQCKVLSECNRGDETQMFCVRLGTQKLRSLNLCFLAAYKCGNNKFELINEGRCVTP